MRFENIPGYNLVKDKLVSMFHSNRVGHALMFSGEEGSGNLALAIAFAQYMSCANRNNHDSCGKCPSCVKFEKHIHPDVHFYFPTTTSPAVPKQALSYKYYEKWRAFLLEEMFVSLSSWIKVMDASKKEALISTDDSSQIIKDLALKSYEGESRFAILWLPEKLNVHSSNKLLKIIEEPPKGVYFFLVTENPELVLSTIMSRTQAIRIGKISQEDLGAWIKNIRPDVTGQALDALVKFADGNPLKAIKAIDDGDDNAALGETFIQWARLCYKAYIQMSALIDYSEKLASLNRDEQKKLLNYGMSFFRNASLLNNEAAELFDGLPDEKENVKNFSPLLNPSNTSVLARLFDLSLRHLERYANPKILFLDLSLNFAKNINGKNVNL